MDDKKSPIKFHQKLKRYPMHLKLFNYRKSSYGSYSNFWPILLGAMLTNFSKYRVKYGFIHM